MTKKQTIVEYVEENRGDIEIREKEVVEYRSQVGFLVDTAKALKVESKEDYEKATELLAQVREVEVALQERKEKITRPLMAGLAEARELFKPLEASHAEAKKTIKEKMLDYSIKEDERIAKEKEKVEARVEKGTMRVDTAVKKLENIGEAPKTNLVTRTKVRITDESLIPREFLVPDMVKINDAVLKNKLTIPGVETYEEKSIVASRR